MSRARDALIAQANLQTLREQSYAREVDFVSGHPKGDERPGSHFEWKAGARKDIYDAAGRVTAALDAAIDAQAELAVLLRDYGRRA